MDFLVLLGRLIEDGFGFFLGGRFFLLFCAGGLVG